MIRLAQPYIVLCSAVLDRSGFKCDQGRKQPRRLHPMVAHGTKECIRTEARVLFSCHAARNRSAPNVVKYNLGSNRLQVSRVLRNNFVYSAVLVPLYGSLVPHISQHLILHRAKLSTSTGRQALLRCIETNKLESLALGGCNWFGEVDQTPTKPGLFERGKWWDALCDAIRVSAFRLQELTVEGLPTGECP